MGVASWEHVMKACWHRMRNGLRIVCAIAVRDTVDAIHSKIVQGIIVGILLTVLMGRALPLILRLSDRQSIVIWDQGKSRAVAKLREQPGISVERVRTRQELEEAVGTSATVRLGVVLPDDFDEIVLQENPIALTGYVVHWAGPSEIASARVALESALTASVERPVHINVAAERIYPSPSSGGFTGMATGVLMTVLVMLGIGLVPYLVIEERQNRTWDVLMVSPAGVGQVIVGKAFAGSVYCLVAASVVLGLNHLLIVHWGVAVLAVFGGTLFSVALGLLMGTLFEQSQNMSTMASVLAALLILPLYAVQVISTLPDAVRPVIAWLPSTALTNLFRVSLSRTIPIKSVWTNLLVLAVSATVLYVLAAWRMTRMER